MSFVTADLYDAHENEVQVAEPLFRSYGGRPRFSGPITTLKLHEDNALVRKALEEPGNGRVLVVDGGGSTRCALVGGNLGELAKKNDWAGIVVYGCIRDSVELAAIDVGIKAINTQPRKSIKKGAGDRDIAVTFAGVSFRPGDYLYSDEDGIVVATKPLL